MGWRLVLFLLGCVAAVTAAAETEKASVRPIFLEGSVSVVDADNKPVRPLKIGDILLPGDRIRTGIKGRLTMILPDGSHVRTDQFTVMEIKTLDVGPAKGERNVVIGVLSGNAWITVPRSYPGKWGFTVSTPSVRVLSDAGTYRVTLNEDGSMMVKVYRGSVDVANSPPARTPGGSPGASKQLIKSMHQLLIRSDGTRTRPFRFTMKSDDSGWVRWNRERDQQLPSGVE